MQVLKSALLFLLLSLISSLAGSGGILWTFNNNEPLTNVILGNGILIIGDSSGWLRILNISDGNVIKSSKFGDFIYDITLLSDNTIVVYFTNLTKSGVSVLNRDLDVIWNFSSDDPINEFVGSSSKFFAYAIYEKVFFCNSSGIIWYNYANRSIVRLSISPRGLYVAASDGANVYVYNSFGEEIYTYNLNSSSLIVDLSIDDYGDVLLTVQEFITSSKYVGKVYYIKDGSIKWVKTSEKIFNKAILYQRGGLLVQDDSVIFVDQDAHEIWRQKFKGKVKDLKVYWENKSILVTTFSLFERHAYLLDESGRKMWQYSYSSITGILQPTFSVDIRDGIVIIFHDSEIQVYRGLPSNSMDEGTDNKILFTSRFLILAIIMVLILVLLIIKIRKYL